MKDTIRTGLSPRTEFDAHQATTRALGRDSRPARSAGLPRRQALTQACVAPRSAHPRDQPRQCTCACCAGVSFGSANEAVRRAQKGDYSVLLLGESGTGKDMAARAIARHGARAGRPLITVNCAEITRDLLRSHLFGHRKGSFTGAVTDQMGAFAAADGGTLFLDEIGEMPVDLQAALLRAIDAREVTPIGAQHATPVDIRLMCATNRDLPAEVAAGRFRCDLYFRIAAEVIRLPPLRERMLEFRDLLKSLQAFTDVTPPPVFCCAGILQDGRAQLARQPTRTAPRLGTRRPPHERARNADGSRGRS